MDWTAVLRLAPILGVIALASFVEFIVPLREQRRLGGGRLRTNLALIATTLALGILFNGLLVAATLYAQGRQLGLFSAFEVPGAVALAVSVLVLDFSGYLVHVLMHKTAWGWRVHLVHHIDTAVDATTALRQHPVEGVLRFVAAAAAALALGAGPGAIALYRLLSAVNAVIEHANVRVPRWLDRALVWFWVTPDMHKVHHSRERSETDSNYSNLFSLFDRVFGTYTPSSRGPEVDYGIDGYDTTEHQSIGAVMLMPFRSSAADDAAEAGPRH